MLSLNYFYYLSLKEKLEGKLKLYIEMNWVVIMDNNAFTYFLPLPFILFQCTRGDLLTHHWGQSQIFRMVKREHKGVTIKFIARGVGSRLKSSVAFVWNKPGISSM